MTTGIIWIAASAIILVFLASFVRGFQRARNSQRWECEQEAWRSRRREEAQERLAAKAERFFPFLKDQLKNGLSIDALRSALQETPGTAVGIGPSGLPVLFPAKLKTRHTAIFGRSGSGKTSLMMRLLDDDLRHGRGIVVLAAEEEVCRDHVLPRVPKDRAASTVYLAPGRRCPITWNPLEVEGGDDPNRWAAEVYVALRAAVGEDRIGPRSDSLARHLFAALVHFPRATFLHVRPFLEDPTFRDQVLTHVSDDEVRTFWTVSYPRYALNSILPLLQRTDRLTTPAVRDTLCQPRSSFSLRAVLDASRILLLDLSGLDPDTTSLLGQLFLARLQLEIMRRERVPEEQRPFTALYVDECHLWTSSSRSWAQLASRMRRYNAGLVIASQFPAQLGDVKREILGNTSCLVSFAVASDSAALLRRELIVPSGKNGGTNEVPAQTLVTLPVGRAFIRLATGALAMQVNVHPPLNKRPLEDGVRIREISWARFKAPSLPAPQPALSYPHAAALELGSTRGPTPGRGGARHKLLQELARQQGEARGFLATIEQEVLGGSGRVDVALVRRDVRIAVEVRVTATAQEVAAALTKSLAAGFTTAIVLSVENRNEDEILEQLDAKDRSRVRFLDPESFQRFLDELPVPTAAEETTVGYRLKVEHEEVSGSGLRARRRTLAQVVGTALLRHRWTP